MIYWVARLWLQKPACRFFLHPGDTKSSWGEEVCIRVGGIQQSTPSATPFSPADCCDRQGTGSPDHGFGSQATLPCKYLFTNILYEVGKHAKSGSYFYSFKIVLVHD